MKKGSIQEELPFFYFYLNHGVERVSRSFYEIDTS